MAASDASLSSSGPASSAAVAGSASISTVPRSSSVTVTVARKRMLVAENVTVSDSSSASSSAWAVTVTVCAVFQFCGVNESAALSTVAALGSLLATNIDTADSGRSCSVAVNVPTLALATPAASFSAKLVGETDASTTVMVNVREARSLSARLMSPSWAYSVTVTAPVVFVDGVPHTVRGAQLGAPKERPGGRPLTS